MDLFGRHGYKATTVAQIEKAAGLSPGSGGLYRHFSSKRELLEAGLRGQIEAGRGLADYLRRPPAGQPLAQLLSDVARAGLRRLEQERNLNLLLLRDLADFPELLDLVREREMRAVHQSLVGLLHSLSAGRELDVEALAAVLMTAVSHYWVLTDVFSGSFPLGVTEDRFLTSLAQLTAKMLE
jgi:AcrR family transcriptional regulator